MLSVDFMPRWNPELATEWKQAIKDWEVRPIWTPQWAMLWLAIYATFFIAIGSAWMSSASNTVEVKVVYRWKPVLDKCTEDMKMRQEDDQVKTSRCQHIPGTGRANVNGRDGEGFVSCC